MRKTANRLTVTSKSSSAVTAVGSSLVGARHATLLPLVQNARFVVLPSKIDDLPNTCLEAMALKRVVIGTRTASFDQVIRDGVNGFLVSQRDDEELSSCMDRVWNMNLSERERIGLEAYRSLEKMNPQAAIRRVDYFL